MARFVMVHGAFAGAWAWGPLAAELEREGHTVEAVDLPGSGDDQTPVPGVTLDAYADRVCAALAERPEPAVVVPNSMGGMAVTQAAARCPERMAAIVYVAAFVPQDGQSLIELTQLPEGADDQIQANLVVDEARGVAVLSDEHSIHAMYECCTDAVARWAVQHQRDQPGAPFAQPAALPAGVVEAIPRSYVLCTRDNAIPPALQRRMVAAAGITDVVELDTDHSPHMSRTEELAELLGRRAG